MKQEEMKEHFTKADKVVLKGITESKENFDRITSIIQQLYSEINKGELIVAAGAFSLIISFLIQQSNAASYAQVGFLKFSVCFLFFVVVWKFHLNRSSAKRAEHERDLINDRLDLFRKIQVANTEFLLKGNTDLLTKVPQLIEKLDLIDKESQQLSSPAFRRMGNLFNELEYIAFFCGTTLLLIFFLFNI